MKLLTSIFAVLCVVVAIVRWLVGIFPRGVALRPVICTCTDPVPDPHEDQPNSTRWYVESKEQFKGMPYSCSFVEFDERGDYLDFHQHRHACQKISALTKAKESLLLVIFVHGWRNHCQSGNVTSFNYFLSELASSTKSTKTAQRVHGLYVSWRGANFGQTMGKDDEHYVATTRHFSANPEDADPENRNPLVDLEKYGARAKWLANLIETLTYHNRKSVPEHKIAGTSISRTILTCAHIAKQAEDSTVILMGHSFGALLLERTLQNSVTAELIEVWPSHVRGQAAAGGGGTAAKPSNPLPFDTVLLVNSAAPSIYAKQFQSFLAAHRAAMRAGRGRGYNAPIFISITSEADWATGKTHPLGNCMAGMSPTLWRDYRADDFILNVAKGTVEPLIPQAYYYKHTPGHNPLLVNRFIEPYTIEGTSPPANTFPTVSTDKSGIQKWWSVNMPPKLEANRKWSRYEAYRPVAWAEAGRETAYWIVRCPEEIISGHNDIWNPAALDMYEGFHLIAERLQDEEGQGSAA